MTWTHDLPPEPLDARRADLPLGDTADRDDQRVILHLGDGTAFRIGDEPRPVMTRGWTDIRRDVWVLGCARSPTTSRTTGTTRARGDERRGTATR